MALQQPNWEEALNTILQGKHPADIALSLDQMLPKEAQLVFSALDTERAAEVLDELPPILSRFLTDNSLPSRVAEMLDLLPMDDAAEIISEASPAQQGKLLAELDSRSPEDAADVRELLAYGEETAGRLMTDKFLRITAQLTVDEAFAAVRHADSEVETLNDLFVVESANGEDERLIGILSLRDLVCAKPSQTISEVMTTDLVTVRVDTDQQDAARILSKYDFLALPVLDIRGYLAGIITVDDIIDVLIEEFTEDYLKLVGTDAEEMARRSPLQVAKLRLPWLMATMLIELMAGVVISRFDWVLREVILLASFMPVISAISGNVGLQAAAIIIRGLDTGHVSLDNLGKAVRKEVLTALLMACACGLILGTIGAVWSRHIPFGFVIGGAMTVSMLTASLMGTIIPIMSKRLGFDPAATAGPFETAFQDVIGFAVFLWLASLLLPWLK